MAVRAVWDKVEFNSRLYQEIFQDIRSRLMAQIDGVSLRLSESEMAESLVGFGLAGQGDFFGGGGKGGLG